MHRGYVKVYRKALDKGWLSNPILWAVWTYCLMKATHKKTETIIGLRVVELEPGQFIFGRKVASEDLDIPETTIYRYIKFLERVGNIILKPNNKFSIITIINWGDYQDTRNNNGQQVDNKRTTSGHIQALKEHKNKDIKKNIKKKDVFIQPYLGEMENVKLTLVEFEKLQSKFSDYESKIDDLSCYIDSKGDKYKSHYSTILMWDRKNVKETKGKSGVLKPTTYAQAQDAERRGRAAWLKGEMDDNQGNSGKGDRKAIPVLPIDKIQ